MIKLKWEEFLINITKPVIIKIINKYQVSRKVMMIKWIMQKNL